MRKGSRSARRSSPQSRRSSRGWGRCSTRPPASLATWDPARPWEGRINDGRTRSGRTGSDGTFDPLAGLGGSLLQDHAIANFVPEVVPAEATVIAKRRTTPLFGLGLVDATPDRTFLAIALTQAILSPSLAGKPSIVTRS